MPNQGPNFRLWSDWSGTISDDRKAIYEMNMRMLDRYGKPRQTFEHWLSVSASSAVEFCRLNGIQGETAALLEECREMYGVVRQDGVNPVHYPDAPAFLSWCTDKHIEIAIISTHPEVCVRAEAKEYDLDQYISCYFGSVENKAAVMLKMACTSGYESTPPVYLGDMAEDIRAARDAGIIPIGITTGYHTRQRLEAEKPLLVVDSLMELTALIF
jgi:phosphoglycolate phosphatase